MELFGKSFGQSVSDCLDKHDIVLVIICGVFFT
jgi:hypothetical protein